MDTGIPFGSYTESESEDNYQRKLRVMSGVPQGSILGPLLFLAYVNHIWKNTESTFRLFVEDCVIYRKIVNNSGIKKLQIDLCRLGEWAVENWMKINSGKSKAVSFTRAQMKNLLNYSLLNQEIPEASSFKYFEIILSSDLSWKALQLTMHILKKGNSSMKSLAYTSLVHPILEYGAAYWDLFREGKINALDWEQKKAAKFANLTNKLKWETLAQCRKIVCIRALYKAYPGELAWKAIGDRLQRSYYLSRANHDWKIRNRRQRTDIRKYLFVYSTIQLWNKLPMNALGTFPSKPSIFRKRVRKVISEVK